MSCLIRNEYVRKKPLHCLKVQQCKLIREARRDNHMDVHKEI